MRESVTILLQDYVIIAGSGVLALASLPQGARLLRGALLLIAACTLAWAVQHRHWWVAGGSAALALINLLQLALSVPATRRTSMSEEEQLFADASFSSLPRGAVRQLFDQGLWISGKAGETLIREGEPASHLFYLSQGEASVLSDGRELATCGPGHFFGEITVLNREPASASVALRTDLRFWCIGADTLKRFIAANPEFAHALEAAFAGDLRDKLRLTNRRLVAMGDAA
ncbi:cyclic nucleotide-binding domain-containing protein [Sphingomonas sp. MMS24-J13]|uniref:cyclic nucleotide-binding domain-containing protein n=1 Tax=Sphingomonas sp. MMS24-J13 TaxID=3238686 RepID=UPI00384D04FA